MSAGLAGEREDMITDTFSIQKDEGWDDLRLLLTADIPLCLVYSNTVVDTCGDANTTRDS